MKIGEVLEVKVGEVEIGGAAMRSQSKIRGKREHKWNSVRDKKRPRFGRSEN